MATKYEPLSAAEQVSPIVRKDRPHPCDAFHKQNVAIALSYFSVGFVMSFAATPLNVYMVSKLGAEPTMQNTIGILQTLPWSLKLIFGFISDTVPIRGMHRKPYLTIGAILYTCAYLLYALSGQDNLTLLAICVFMATLGLVQMDVMADTMCVERSKFEDEEIKGQMQATFYSVRFTGGLIGALLGACVCNQENWGWGLEYRQVAFINSLIPFCLVVPFLYSLREKYHVNHMLDNLDGNVEMGEINLSDDDDDDEDDDEEDNSLKNKELFESTGSYQQQQYGAVTTQTLSTKKKSKPIGRSKSVDSIVDEDVDDTSPVNKQLWEIWQTVQLRSVWRPMCFVYIFNMFQVPNVAWQSYLQLSLHFPSWVLGLTVLLGSFMTFAGVLVYKYFLFGTSWRKIYIWSACLTSFFSLMQLVLIFQINTKYLGINNYFFSLGDDVITAYISGIQFLPICIMYMRLCPDGAEGASYAMLTTLGNIAMVCASNVGNLFTGIWDVSNAAMRRNDVDGLWKLSVLTSTIALVPLCLLFLLPKSPKDQARLAASKKRSKVAGIIFLSVLFGSLVWTTSTAIYRIVQPTIG